MTGSGGICFGALPVMTREHLNEAINQSDGISAHVRNEHSAAAKGLQGQPLEQCSDCHA